MSQSARRLLCGVSLAAVILAASGCTCSSPEAGLDGAIPADGGSTDGGLVVPRDVGASCDLETGQGCPCPEEGLERGCATAGVGACGMGTQTCTIDFELPSWGACTGDAGATDETCNGIDDDCDGTTDEGFGEESCGIGPCEATVPICVAGVEQSCVPLGVRDETCDGFDEDCDGTVDEELGALDCGVGICAVSVAACVGGEPQDCTPGAPSEETCNGLDDDCDGTIDESLGSTTCGVGECGVAVTACTAGAPTICTPGDPVDELCNGLDDDCNGTVDDGFGTTVCGVGACRTVVLDCDGGGGGACTPGTPTAEVCDGIDNDCNGTADDGIAALSCGVGACARTQAACVGGMAQTCTPGAPSGEVCDGVDNDCNGTVDEGIPARTCGQGICRRTTACASGAFPTCVPGPADAAETCGNGLDDDCNGIADDGCDCSTSVDADFDGVNECADCNDNNGGVYPGRAEICNGVDEDCDTRIDEDFDVDGDLFATCTTDPRLRDCDDGRASVYPGAPEICDDGMGGQTGNGIDDNCDGYIDNGCNPCTTTDVDMDGVTECEGDCDDMDASRTPGAAEVCDGLDSDCNIFTTDNCGVSEYCRNPDGTPYADGTDACEPDLLCGCLVDRSGTCRSGSPWICTSFCEGSYTGDLGGGCSATQTCTFRVTATNNQHGCGEVDDGMVGTLLGGSECSNDLQCRSNNCDRLCIGMGCNRDYCVDFCDHHAPGEDGSCASGTVCSVLDLGGASAAQYATCRLDNTGTGNTGDACSSTSRCRFGTASCVSGICAEPCGIDAHCPGGTHCSMEGNGRPIGTYGATADPSYLASATAIEVVPVCLTNTGPGLHNRQGGAACARNSDCTSQFCEASLGTCIALCTTDASCPTGTTCEPQHVRTSDGVALSRVCVSTPIDALLEAM